MMDEPLYAAGLSGDLGWNEAEETPMPGLGMALMVLASSVVWGSLWLLSGLPPLVSVVGHVKSRGQQP